MAHKKKSRKIGVGGSLPPGIRQVEQRRSSRYGKRSSGNNEATPRIFRAAPDGEMHYDEDEDDNTSAVIVYREESSPNDATQRSHATQTLKRSLSPIRDVQCTSRYERRKRHFEWRELANHFEPSLSHVEAPVENAFASLQKLLESQQTTETDEIKAEITGETAMECDPPEREPSSRTSGTRTMPSNKSKKRRLRDGDGGEIHSTPMTAHEDTRRTRHRRPREDKEENSGRTWPQKEEYSIIESLEKPTPDNPEISTISAEPQDSHSQSTAVVPVPSIVGSRPKGWARVSARPPVARMQKQKRPAKGVLAAATRMPSERLKRQQLTRKAVTKEVRFLASGNDGSTAQETIEKDQVPRMPPSITFAPSFLPSGQKGSLKTTDIDQADIESSTLDELNEERGLGSLLSGRKRRSSKHGGPLSQRLATLLKLRSNDLVRLQNPAFSRHSVDMNNPRKLAKSHTDITVLGSSVGSWMKKDEGGKLTVLVYIHRHVPKQAGEGSIEKVLGWACFDPAIARVVGLKEGIALRVYNAQLIPSRHRVQMDPGLIPGADSTVCRYFVVCTSLCETYPSALEPLPAILGPTESTDKD